MSTRSSYDIAASWYDTASQWFSGGGIQASKRAQLDYIQPGTSILYLGVGTGQEAVRAAGQGAQVTCVDQSAKMLDRLRGRLQQAGQSADLIQGDVLQLAPSKTYDVVAANYFLNCFSAEQLPAAMRVATQQVAAGGYMMIADVALPHGNVLAQQANRAYLMGAMAFFWTLGLVPWHKNHDYPAHFAALGLELETVSYFRLSPIGPITFQNIVARRTR